MSSQETADYLDINVETLYRRWEQMGLKGYRVLNKLKFRERDIEAWIDRQKV